MVVGGSAFPLNYFYLFFFSDFSFNSELKKKKKNHEKRCYFGTSNGNSNRFVTEP